MFAGLTATATVDAATTWAAQIAPVGLVVAGAIVAIGLTSWVIKKLRASAR